MSMPVVPGTPTVSGAAGIRHACTFRVRPGHEGTGYDKNCTILRHRETEERARV